MRERGPAMAEGPSLSEGFKSEHKNLIQGAAWVKGLVPT